MALQLPWVPANSPANTIFGNFGSYSGTTLNNLLNNSCTTCLNDFEVAWVEDLNFNSNTIYKYHTISNEYANSIEDIPNAINVLYQPSNYYLVFIKQYGNTVGVPIQTWYYTQYGQTPPYQGPPDYTPPGYNPPGYLPPINNPPGFTPPMHSTSPPSITHVIRTHMSTDTLVFIIVVAVVLLFLIGYYFFRKGSKPISLNLNKTIESFTKLL